MTPCAKESGQGSFHLWLKLEMTMEGGTPVSSKRISKGFDNYLEVVLFFISARHKNKKRSHSQGMPQPYIPQATWCQCGPPIRLIEALVDRAGTEIVKRALALRRPAVRLGSYR
jgi:hypothetical protein